MLEKPIKTHCFNKIYSYLPNALITHSSKFLSYQKSYFAIKGDGSEQIKSKFSEHSIN